MPFPRILPALAPAVLATTASAQLLQAEAWLWDMAPEGDVEISGVLGFTPRADVEDDLGVDGEAIPGVTVLFGDRWQIGASGFRTELSGDQVAGRSVEVLGRTFSASTRVQSSLDLTLARAFVRWNLGGEPVRIALEGGAQYADVAVAIEADRVGEAEASAEVVIPYGGIGVDARPVDWLSLRGSLRYMTFDWGDIEATWSEFDVGARAHLLGHLTIGAGYRGMGVEVDAPDDNLFTDLTFQGPYAALGLEW